jgi:hypothetical protein
MSEPASFWWRDVAITTCEDCFAGCCRARVARAWPGPTSSKMAPGILSNSARPASNLTACLRWFAQYIGSVASSALTHVPVRFET